VEESLLLFKGRLEFKLFIKSKRAHFGNKNELCIKMGILLDLYSIHWGHVKRTDQHFGKDFVLSERIQLTLLQSVSLPISLFLY